MAVHVEISLLDGTSEGLRTASIGNWTGTLIAGPREKLSEIREIPAAKNAGVYLLIGHEHDSIDTPSMYIGRADNLVARLGDHERTSDGSKDFWTWQVLVTSENQSLGQSETTWLESELIQLARNDHLVTLTNIVTPAKTPLKIGAQITMKSFLANILLLLPLLNARIVNSAESTRTQPIGIQSPSPATWAMEISGAAAECKIEDGAYIIQKGSTALVNEMPSCEKYIKKIRKKLLQKGILRIDPVRPDLYLFSTNYRTSSPSAAASIVAGCGLNGLLKWHVAGTNLTLRDWRKTQIVEVLRSTDS